MASQQAGDNGVSGLTFGNPPFKCGLLRPFCEPIPLLSILPVPHCMIADGLPSVISLHFLQRIFPQRSPMVVPEPACPTDQELAAYRAGRRTLSGSDTIQSHLIRCPKCIDKLAMMPVSPASNPEGQLPPELANHPQYVDIRELGRGAMGVVFLAQNRMMNRPEVLKVVNRSALHRPGAKERFLQEVRTAARLQHRNVVAAYSVAEVGESLVFAMEYVAGTDLDKLVKRDGPLPVAKACRYIAQVALGLQHAFEKEMVHRDIKPANLLLSIDGRNSIVKIADFGLAKVTSERDPATGLTGAGQIMGTPDYIAPEQALDAARADIRADLYSLGCSLYFLLAGQPPFRGKSLSAVLFKHQSESAVPLHQRRDDVPEDLSALVARLMEKDPAARFQTPAEVASALKPFFGFVRPKSTATLSTEIPKATPSATIPSFSDNPNTDLSQSSPGETESADRNGDIVKPKLLWVAVAGGTFLTVVLVAWSLGAFPWTARKPVREIPETIAKATEIKESEPEEPWQPLFRDDQLTDWMFEKDIRFSWLLRNGVLAATRVQDSIGIRNTILTKKMYSDYTIRLEINLGEEANSGIIFRGLDDEKLPVGKKGLLPRNPILKLVDNRKSNQKTEMGELLWVIDSEQHLPVVKTQFKYGDWNSLEITVRGKTLHVTINQQTIWNTRLNEDTRAYRGIVPALKRTSGRIGFLLNSGTIQIRNAMIREWK
jgi:serine/threonine protein kinase